jgi:hypothetical protein
MYRQFTFHHLLVYLTKEGQVVEAGNVPQFALQMQSDAVLARGRVVGLVWEPYGISIRLKQCA